MPFTSGTTHVAAAALFAAAVLHTLLAARIARLADRFPRHARVLHWLGEVELVFCFWAIVLVAFMAVGDGARTTLAYLASRSYTEPIFIFVVMVVAASRPVLHAVAAAMEAAARRTPLPPRLALAWLGLAAAPLLGSLITEPAAMTVAALMLAPIVFQPAVPERCKYLALGVLFVNVSIGGTLTAYAAPPVLMVASAWNWDSAAMVSLFGWKAAIAVVLNAAIAAAALRPHISGETAAARPAREPVPAHVVLTHLAFLAGAVLLAHQPAVLLVLLLAFLGVARAFRIHQSPLILREALLVALFLAGLVILGGMQRWWLEPVVEGLQPLALFFSAVGLTAVVDNAALTYLGSQIGGLGDAAKYMLVAGAVAGGGLTVIANAPNPAGAALLKRGFAGESIDAMGLLLGALLPTCVAAAAFLLL